MTDWINKAVDKIHAEYPRVLAECNEHTPRPWLHAVIRDAAPRCDGCKHYRQDPGPPVPGPSFGECLLNTSIHMTHLQDYNNAMAWGAHFYVEPGFGCVKWEAK